MNIVDSICQSAVTTARGFRACAGVHDKRLDRAASGHYKYFYVESRLNAILIEHAPHYWLPTNNFLINIHHFPAGSRSVGMQ